MTDLVKDEDTQMDYLNMSDEELSQAPVPDTAPVTVEAEAEVADEEPVDKVDDAAEDAADEASASDDSDDKPEVLDDKEEQTEKTKPEEVKPADKPAEVDYKAAYEKLFTPFKANGKDIAINTVDDAISLMQMGANYNKKMAALKPNLKLMKLLENNGLLSEEKLSYLIDLEKKNPEAINKLMKDSGMDPMDLDAEKASGYKPNTYTVDDREMELDSVLDEIQGTPSYNRTLEIVSTKWDGPSKQVIAGSPQLLKVINDHVQSGIYDTIVKEVESERMFGRLNGLSDIEAYRQVGDSIQSRGGFAPVNKGQQVPAKAVIVPPKPKVDEDKLREKRRAASSTKPAGASQVNQEYNPLALDDDAFGKLVKNAYL